MRTDRSARFVYRTIVVTTSLQIACGGSVATSAEGGPASRPPVHDDAGDASRRSDGLTDSAMVGQDHASLQPEGSTPPKFMASFDVIPDQSEIDFERGVRCAHVLGGGPDQFTIEQGSARPAITTSFTGVNFHVECLAALPGSGDPVSVTLDFAGANGFTLDDAQNYQLSNLFTLTVTETTGTLRTCQGVVPPGNYALANTTPVAGFPRLWPTDAHGAATPAVFGQLSRGGFAATSPVFQPCDGWGSTLNAAFGPVVTFQIEYRLTY